jgi:hypothetical protein
MTRIKTDKLPLTLNIDVTDKEAVQAAADALGTTPENITRTIDFSHEVFAVAEHRGLTKGQLATALLSVVGILVKEAGDEEGRKEMCMKMFEGMWATAEITSTPWSKVRDHYFGVGPSGTVH